MNGERTSRGLLLRARARAGVLAAGVARIVREVAAPPDPDWRGRPLSEAASDPGFVRRDAARLVERAWDVELDAQLDAEVPVRTDEIEEAVRRRLEIVLAEDEASTLVREAAAAQFPLVARQRQQAIDRVRFAPLNYSDAAGTPECSCSTGTMR